MPITQPKNMERLARGDDVEDVGGIRRVRPRRVLFDDIAEVIELNFIDHAGEAVQCRVLSSMRRVTKLQLELNTENLNMLLRNVGPDEADGGNASSVRHSKGTNVVEIDGVPYGGVQWWPQCNSLRYKFKSDDGAMSRKFFHASRLGDAETAYAGALAMCTAFIDERLAKIPNNDGDDHPGCNDIDGVAS